MKTTAVVLFETGKPLRLLELDMPALRDGQVLVKVAYSGVCRSQLMEVQGKRGTDKYLPHLLGHEGSGIVLDVGRGVSKVKPGDGVVLTWIKGKGMDVAGPNYRLGRRRINAGPITTFCMHTIVSENRCVRVQKKTPLDIAALCGCALPTGAGIVMHELNLRPGSTIGVFGVGGIGLSAVLALGLHRCAMVIAVDRDLSKLRMARRLGATHVFNSRAGDVLAEIARLTNGRGLDFSVEASGTASGIENAFAAVRKSGGLCVFASHPPSGSRICLDPYDLICGKQIRGSWGGSATPDQDIPKLLRFQSRGEFPMEQMITHRYPLKNVNEALAVLESGEAGRILLDMNYGVCPRKSRTDTESRTRE